MKIVSITTKSGATAEILIPDEPVLSRDADNLTLDERLTIVQRYIVKKYGSPQPHEQCPNHTRYPGPQEGMMIGDTHVTADTPLDPDQWGEGGPWSPIPKA